MNVWVIPKKCRFDSFGAESFYTVDTARGAAGMKKKFHICNYNIDVIIDITGD